MVYLFVFFFLFIFRTRFLQFFLIKKSSSKSCHDLGMAQHLIQNSLCKFSVKIFYTKWFQFFVVFFCWTFRFCQPYYDSDNAFVVEMHRQNIVKAYFLICRITDHKMIPDFRFHNLCSTLYGSLNLNPCMIPLPTLKVLV